MNNPKLMRGSDKTAMSWALWANVVAGIAGSGLVAVPVLAQPAASSGGIEEVVVTARRVQENLQRVPVAVSAVSAEALQQKSITKVEELSHTVPGFTAQTSYQPGAPVYTIRGQHGDTNPTANTEPAVQVYFAEMNTARAIGTNSAFFDLESVQVLKGPQGTLFGRNSTGGAVLITPRAPQDTFGGYIQGSVGNFDLRDYEAALNVPFDDKVALRVGGKVTKRDGYIENVLNNQKGGGADEASGRISLLLKPTDAVKSTFIVTSYQSKSDGNTFKLTKIEPKYFAGSGLGFAVPFLQAEVDQLAALGPYKLASSVPVYSHDRVSSIQNNTEIELSDSLTLKNIVGFRRTTNGNGSDFTAGIHLGDLYNNQFLSTSDFFTEELQLQGKGPNLTYVVGGYVLHEAVDIRVANAIFGGFATPPVDFGLPLRYFIHNDYNTSSYAGFGHLNYDLSSFMDGLSISGGARLTYDLKKASIRDFLAPGTPVGISGFTCLANFATYAFQNEAACDRAERITSTELTYDVSLNYQLNPETLVYVAHRHGYRAGGFDIVIPFGTQNPNFKPEKVDDVELGVKSDFHLGEMPGRLNVAGYYQKYKNIQRLIALPLNGTVVNSTINVASAVIYGGEMELTLKPTSALDLSATYAYTKADTKVWNIPYGGGLLDASDSFFNYVAPHQWSLTGRYSLPVPAQYGELSLSAIWYGQTAMHAADNSTGNCGPDGLNFLCLGRNVVVPKYDLVNLRLDWKNIGGKGFDLGIFATNVANKEYLSSVIGLNGVLGTQADMVGAPRMYGVTLKVAFGGEAP